MTQFNNSASLRAITATTLCALALSLCFAASANASVTKTLDALESSGQIDAATRAEARQTYFAAKSLQKKLTSSRKLVLTNNLRLLESLAKKSRLGAGRVRPLFAQLKINTDWFRTKGPAAVGTRARLGEGRIYYQYFAGWGWQFHPLANFSRLNAIWRDKSAAARRSLAEFSRELIGYGVVRGGALTWEYYFPFSGSSAPFISSISQGTAIQSLARAGAALADSEITAAATRGARAFDVAAPTGLKVSMDNGLHFAGYSGSPNLVIFNMFAQALDGLHDYAKITDDAGAMELFERGLVAARVQMPQADTGAWSFYSLGGAESNLNYHLVLVEFLSRLCEDTAGETTFCALRDRLDTYSKEKPQITGISKKSRRGRLYVTFTLSKISTVTVSLPGAKSATATVARGKRTFSLKTKSKDAVTITARDLAGNSLRVKK